VNITNQASTATMQFFDSSGVPMPLMVGEGGEETTTSVFMIAVGAKGAAFARTFPIGNPPQIGYAQITSAPARSVAVSATFNQVVPGRPLFQSFIPLSTSVHDQFFVPVLNGGSSTGSVAIVSLAEQEVGLTLRDRNGIVLCSATKMFTAGQHRAFVIKTDRELGCAPDRNTVLEVIGALGGLAGVGVTAEDTGSFSTQPVYGPVPAPILAGQ
jgi:hypothetical protein